MTAADGWKFLLAAVILAGCVWMQYSIHFNSDDGKQKIAVLKAGISKQKKMNEEMKIRTAEKRTALSELKNNQDYVEELARKWLFMIKPDEVYVVPAAR